jgi:hypothetical protein
MQRLNRNLSVALAVVGITLIGSAAFAHGGGGGGGHGGSVGHSGGSFARGQSFQSRTVRSVQPKTATRNFVNIANPGGPRNPRGPRPPRNHPWPPYHMHYPVRFWFGGHFDVGEVVEGGIDVEFTSIRQLDAGDAAKNLAPAYRVWFHNNSDVDINQPFDVAVLGSNDQTLTTNLPYAAVRVDGMAADETMSVDIRLPIDAMSMATVDGQPAAYTYLHTIVDSENELVETNKANNLSVYARQDIPMLGD